MAINIENREDLIIYLHQRPGNSKSAITEIRVLTGGISNRTVFIQFSDGNAWVCKQALHKLRVKEDWYSHPARIVREALGMEYLNLICSTRSVPQLIFLDKNAFILGMKAVPEPHKNFKEILLKGQFDNEYFYQFGNLLGEIQAQSALRWNEMPEELFDTRYFESLRLEPYYSFTASKLPDIAPFLNKLIKDTRNNQYTLVHGDYSPKNILIHNDQIVLLDHEVIHIGDGTFDIGFSLCHLLSKYLHMIEAREKILTGIEYYWAGFAKSGPKLDRVTEARAVSQTIACLVARVHGRSPLEYLTEVEKTKQTEIGLKLIRENPATIPELIHLFVKSL